MRRWCVPSAENPPPRSRARRLAGVPVLVAVLLAVVPARAASATAPVPSAATARADGQPSLADVVPEIEAFVARVRGLAFVRPVRVTALDDARFQARVLGGGGARPRPPADTGASFQALHLVGSARRYDDREASTSAAGILGFYLPGRDELVVRATSATPFARGVLAHELTHALQDQHFDLSALQRRGTDNDRAAAVAALYEGDAVTTEVRYRASLSAGDRAVYDAQEARAGSRDTSREARAVGAFLGFPYAYGPDLVAALRRAGGQRRLDQAFRDPPTSTEQVVDVTRYGLGGRRDAPGSLPRLRPPGRARVADGGVLGAYGLAVVLASKVDQGTRSRAALGWHADRYVTWRTASGYCTRVRVALDTSRDRAELLAALRAFVRGYPRSGSTVTADRSDARLLTLLSCG